MAEKLGEAVLELRTDDSRLNRGIDQAKGRAEQLAADFDRIGSRAMRTGGLLTLGITTPLAAFGVSAFKAAGDAEELQSAFDHTFGGMADEMNRWAVATGDAMGRSTQAIQRGAFALGGLFNAAAPTREEAARLARQFTVLSQDLGAFFNVAEDDALLALRSGLSGEAEPLRRFNIYINEAAVKAKALEMGLVPLNGELTDQQRILARAALIMEQTADAQGAVGREFGSSTNQLRVAAAAYEELQVTLGTKLLPVFTPLITMAADLLGWFTRLPEGVQTTAVAFSLIGAAIGPALLAFGGLLRGIAALIPLLVRLPALLGAVRVAMLALLANPILLAAAAVIAGIFLAWQNWDKIKPIIEAIGAAVTGWWNDNVRPVLEALGTKIAAVIRWFQELPGRIGTALATLRDAIAAVVMAIGQRIADFLGFWARLPGQVIEAVRQLYLGVRQWLQERLGAIFDGIMSRVQAVADKFKWLWDVVVGNSYVPDMVDGIAAEFARLDGEMVAPAGDATDQVAQGFADMAERARGSIDSIIDRIRSGDFLGALQGAIGLLGQIGEFLSSSGATAAGGWLSNASRLLGSIFGGGFAGGFATGGLIPSGSFGIVGERGPEPVIGTSRGAMVLPNRAMRGFSGPRELHVTVSGARGNAEIEAMVRSGVSQGLAAYDNVVGERVQEHLARRS